MIHVHVILYIYVKFIYVHIYIYIYILAALHCFYYCNYIHPYPLYIPYIYTIFTSCLLYIHPIYTLYIPYICSLFTSCLLYIHPYPLYIPYIYTIFTSCLLYIHPYPLYIPYMCSLFTSCLLYIHSVGHSDNFPAEKRSIIPFDVTKMSYEQYCAKWVVVHYCTAQYYNTTILCNGHIIYIVYMYTVCSRIIW